MPPFRLSKIDSFRQYSVLHSEDVVDIKFPSELASDYRAFSENKADDILIFVVDDDPSFMQILNTHLSKISGSPLMNNRKIIVKNYATGKRCVDQLGLKPDLIFLNYTINEGIPNSLSGKETLDQLIALNANQKVLILNDLKTSCRQAFIESGLRDYIISDPSAVDELNDVILDILFVNS